MLHGVHAIRIRASALREEYFSDKLLVGYVPGAKNAADLGTKAVPLARLQELLALVGLAVVTAPTQPRLSANPAFAEHRRSRPRNSGCSDASPVCGLRRDCRS